MLIKGRNKVMTLSTNTSCRQTTDRPTDLQTLQQAQHKSLVATAM